MKFWLYAVGAAVALLFTLLIAQWFNSYITDPLTAIATQSPQVSTLETKTIVPKQVVVLESKAKVATKLPKPVQMDPKQHVISSTKVDYSLVPRTVTTVFDEDTGESTTYVFQEPTPWLGVHDRGEVVLAYGIKKEGTVVRLAARQELLQIKSAGAGVVGHIDTDGDYFVGAGVSYRW